MVRLAVVAVLASIHLQAFVWGFGATPPQNTEEIVPASVSRPVVLVYTSTAELALIRFRVNQPETPAFALVLVQESFAFMDGRSNTNPIFGPIHILRLTARRYFRLPGRLVRFLPYIGGGLGRVSFRQNLIATPRSTTLLIPDVGIAIPISGRTGMLLHVGFSYAPAHSMMVTSRF